MLDFSGVTAVTIPEGAVERIVIGGEVVWQADGPAAQSEVADDD